MQEKNIKIEFLDRNVQHSDYDWANIDVDGTRVGKARCLKKDDEFVIYSINIFPEFEGNGYGKVFVKEAQKKFPRVIADRVRSTAIGFWEKLGFKDDHNGNFTYKK